MKGWQTFLVGLLTSLGLAGLSGCTHSCLNKECDWAHNYKQDKIPLSLELDAGEAITATIPTVSDPVTVIDAERAPHYLSLQEAFALALEHGVVGAQSINAAGQVSDDLVSFAGRSVSGSDAIRVLALDPAITGSFIDAALARFDPQWNTRMAWNTVDEPTQGFSSFSNGSTANFETSLAKPLPTGGVAGITFNTDYRLLSNPPGGTFAVLNPSYTSRLLFGFEQPLLRGFGVETNQLIDSLPGSNLFPFVNGRRQNSASEGILVTRLRFDQQRAEFERAIHFQLLNVEAAYWRLYGTYMTLYAAEQALRQAHAAWMISKSRFQAGNIENAQFALVRAQYEQFRAERTKAMGDVIDAERALRVLLGLCVEDGKRLVPIDAPTLTPYQPNWQAAVRDCLTLRPELVMARQELQARQLNLSAQKNQLLPDLRFQANYSLIGLGNRLTGGSAFPPAIPGQPTSSLRTLAENDFENWTIGLNLNVPIGYRYEYATTRQARLQLAQSYHLLKDQERRAQTALAKQYSQVIENYKLIEIRRLAREALAEQLQGRFKQFAAGAKGATLEFLLDAQRQWASALSSEFQTIVDYNVSLAAFEFARGTILERNKVLIAEGPLPHCAQVRAVEHEKERTQAIVLREKAHPIIYPPIELDEAIAPLPCMPKNQAPTLPALLHGAPPVPTNLDDKVIPAHVRKDDPRGMPDVTRQTPGASEAPKALLLPPSVQQPPQELLLAPPVQYLPAPSPADVPAATSVPGARLGMPVSR